MLRSRPLPRTARAMHQPGRSTCPISSGMSIAMFTPTSPFVYYAGQRRGSSRGLISSIFLFPEWRSRRESPSHPRSWRTYPRRVPPRPFASAFETPWRWPALPRSGWIGGFSLKAHLGIDTDTPPAPYRHRPESEPRSTPHPEYSRPSPLHIRSAGCAQAPARARRVRRWVVLVIRAVP